MENFGTEGVSETLETLCTRQEALVGKIIELSQNVGQYGEGNFGEELKEAMEEHAILLKKIVEAGVAKGKQGDLNFTQ